jgi:hypothetical protein
MFIFTSKRIIIIRKLIVSLVTGYMPIYEGLPQRSHADAWALMSPIYIIYISPSLNFIHRNAAILLWYVILYAQLFLRARPYLTVNTVFHSCKKIANSVLRDKQGLRISEQDIPYLRNIIGLHGTGVIVTSLTRMRKLQSSLPRFLRKSWYNNMEYRFLRPMFTKSVNKGENCK